MTHGTIQSIEEVKDMTVNYTAPLYGSSGGRLGFSQMLDGFFGGGGMDGYKIQTTEETYYVLIDNGQSCCENWGYFSSDDNFGYFVGADLHEIVLTDTVLKPTILDLNLPYFGDSEDHIQFVDFRTSKGTLQIAVYNSHNGYYGHSILIGSESNILLTDTL